MRLLVQKTIRLKKGDTLTEMKPGQTVEIRDHRKADPLIQRGYLKPVPPLDSSGKPQAVRIFSEVVGEPIWVVFDPRGMQYVQAGEVAYTTEEIRNLRDATPEEVRAVHQVKKAIGGNLIQVKEREGVSA